MHANFVIIGYPPVPWEAYFSYVEWLQKYSTTQKSDFLRNRQGYLLFQLEYNP